VFLILATLVLGACGGAATPAPSWPADAIVVTARNLQFDTKELQINGETDTTLVLINGRRVTTAVLAADAQRTYVDLN